MWRRQWPSRGCWYSRLEGLFILAQLCSTRFVPVYSGSTDFGGSLTSHDGADFQSPVSVLSTLCVGGASIQHDSYADASLSVRGILGAAADAVDLGGFTVGSLTELSVVGAVNIGSVFVRVQTNGSYVTCFDREFLCVMGPIFGFTCDLRELGRFRHFGCFTTKVDSRLHRRDQFPEF